MKIKLIAFVVAIVVIAFVITGCGISQRISADITGGSHVELLMPGNTLVIGNCEDFYRVSNGWIKVKIDGTWYACNEWRVVLKENKNDN